MGTQPQLARAMLRINVTLMKVVKFSNEFTNQIKGEDCNDESDEYPLTCLTTTSSPSCVIGCTLSLFDLVSSGINPENFGRLRVRNKFEHHLTDHLR